VGSFTAQTGSTDSKSHCFKAKCVGLVLPCVTPRWYRLNTAAKWPYQISEGFSFSKLVLICNRQEAVVTTEEHKPYKEEGRNYFRL
jgi:hypothetical protein